MPTINPSPKTWTFRFKHHRRTIVLHVDPLQSFSDIRTELQRALYITQPDGTLNGHAIPDYESDILLARPVDTNDLTLGWESLEQSQDNADLFQDKKGKGKAGASKTSTNSTKNNMTDCPQGAGLRDGAVLAFRFKSEADAASNAEKSGDAIIDIDDGLEGEALVPERKPENWDVVIPSVEELYGLPGEEEVIMEEKT